MRIHHLFNKERNQLNVKKFRYDATQLNELQTIDDETLNDFIIALLEELDECEFKKISSHFSQNELEECKKYLSSSLKKRYE